MVSGTLFSDILIDIIDLITSSDASGLSAAEITNSLLQKYGLERTRYNYKRMYDRLSYWLPMLSNSGIIVSERSGKTMYYKASPSTRRGQAYIRLVPNDGGEAVVAAGDTLFVDTDTGTIVVFFNVGNVGGESDSV